MWRRKATVAWYYSCMTRTLLIVCLASGAFAQPAFEVASIRPSSQQPDARVDVGLHIDGAHFRVGSFSLKDYLGMAYRMKAYQITGPDWIGSERFDLAATLPAGASTELIPEMLQALLAERFQVRLHRDKKEFPVYVLEIGKGPLKLRVSPPDPDGADAEGKGTANVAASGSGQGVFVNLGHGSSYSFVNNRFEATKLNMADWTGNLERFMDRPIVDMTGLKGNYDFALDLTQEDYRIMLIRSGVNAGIVLPPEALRLLEGGAPVSLFDAVQKLGLKLEARKAPLDVLVIDEARKTPTDN
jgi:uncharacterized protein (TIGR03435 family)